jgi:hypothetical protein
MFSASETSSIEDDLGVGLHDDAGHRRDLGEALLLHQQFESAEAAAAGGHLEHAGLVAIGVEDGRTLRLWIRPRRAMEFGQSSIETPAFTRRTLDWRAPAC